MKFVFLCSGYFEGKLHQLAMFDNEDAAHDFCIEQDGGVYNDVYFDRIPIFSSLNKFHEG